MRKKIEKHATVRIMPPDKITGDSIVQIHAESCEEIDVDLCMEHRAAMELLFSLLMDHQVADLRKRTFKH